jgi:hypothetical protein
VSQPAQPPPASLASHLAFAVPRALAVLRAFAVPRAPAVPRAFAVLTPPAVPRVRDQPVRAAEVTPNSVPERLENGLPG